MTQIELGTAKPPPLSAVLDEPTERTQRPRSRLWSRFPFAVEAVLILAVWAAGAAVFFRQQLGSGFGKIMGNDGDARLAVFVTEHWFRALHVQVSWLSPQFFYPVKGLLGWSDTFFLYEIFYAPLRELGFDPFLAMQLTLMALSLVGFVSFVCVVRLAFGAPRLIALAGGLLFAFANNLFLHSGSFQFSGLYFVPVVLLLGLLAWRSRSDHAARSAVLGGACGLLCALLFFSTYYVSWFSALATGVTLVVLVLCGWAPTLLRAAVTAWKGLAGAVTGLVIGIVPFLVTYLPARTHHLTYAQTLGYAGRLRDVANVGGGNLLWSRVLHHFDPRMTVASENSYAVTPFVMLLVVVGGLLAVWLLRSHRAERPANAWAAAALAVATLVLCVLPLHTRFGTPWAVVWHIPGASPIRAMGRLELVTNLAAALVVVAIATEMAAKIRGARRATLLRTTGTLVLALAVLEQVNTTQGSQINRPQQLALLRSVKAPGGECRSFYVTDARQPDMPFFEFQVDAMLISQKLGMPTLNGYTAYNPPGWNLETPGGLLYPIYVSSWAAAKGLGSGVCGLDLATMTWTVGLPSGAPAGTPLPG